MEELNLQALKKVFVTGATGNIGRAVIRHLLNNPVQISVIAGVRNIQKAKSSFAEHEDLQFRQFDFENPVTYENSLEEYDTVFLLRPPHLSKVETFIPLIEAIQKAGIKEIVFLSVQGADKSRVIPHNKIERLIKSHTIPYIFIRPSYFMQNLTTTLYQEIKEDRTITLPAGKAKFNWVDIEDIAESTAHLILNFSKYQGQALDVTGSENESFEKVVSLINEHVDSKLTYCPVGPFKFYRLKKRQGMQRGFIMVMLLLHYLPRFQKEPRIANSVEKLTGKKPTSLKEFIIREKKVLE